MNILPLVMQYFGPVIMNKIAGSLGINSTLAQRAIASAAPAILAGLVGKVMQPGGAKILGDLIAKQDPALLGKLGEMIGTGKQAGVVEQGTSALGGLLGNSTLGALAGALSKQAGLGAGASNTLLGLMAPAVLGTLGKEQKSSGLDAAGLANMLISQKQSIADALPSDFAKLLGGTGLLDGIQAKAGDASAAAVKPAAAASTVAAAKPVAAKPMPAKPASVAPVAAAHHHHFSWGPWLIVIAAACALWWTLFGNKVMQDQMTMSIPAEVPPSTTLATTAALPEAVAKTDIGKSLLAVMDESRGTVASVRDAATATAALPRFQDIAGRLEKLQAQAAQMSPDTRRALSTYVMSQTGLLKTAVANVLALPGVGPILKPAADQLLGRIEALTKG